jgi:spore maturation protein CgeB
VKAAARDLVRGADAAMVTSYCPDAVPAAELVLAQCGGVRAFYDLDTPVTLEGIEAGQRAPYLPAGGLGDFDVVLSFTGGRALDALRSRLGARRVVPIFGSVDPLRHYPTTREARFASDLCYLGTYSADRHAAVVELLVEPARHAPERRFLLAGALYPGDFPWQENVFHVPHVPPSEHATFYGSAELSLNVTRGTMARWGWCPSGRLFEAAACGAPQVTDDWEGLEHFFTPGSEILVARSAADVLAAISAPSGELAAMAQRARARVLDEHTADVRARSMVRALEWA